MDSKLTTGGAYVTGEEITSFKGYYRNSSRKYVVLSRSFVQFDGEGDAANARPRAIGGHPAVLLGEYVCEKIRTVRMRTAPVTFRLESWWITPAYDALHSILNQTTSTPSRKR
jgi:hypothetical protein